MLEGETVRCPRVIACRESLPDHICPRDILLVWGLVRTWLDRPWHDLVWPLFRRKGKKETTVFTTSPSCQLLVILAAFACHCHWPLQMAFSVLQHPSLSIIFPLTCSSILAPSTCAMLSLVMVIVVSSSRAHKATMVPSLLQVYLDLPKALVHFQVSHPWTLDHGWLCS